jgi:yecA family protein
MHPEEWVCPLLGVAPDAFNHDTKTFSAIAATLMRNNAISETLSTKPESFEPLFLRRPDGEMDPQPWCMGFYAVINLRPIEWSRLTSPNTIEHKLLRPILIHCVDGAGLQVLDAQPRAKSAPSFALDPGRDIPAAVEALQQFWMPIRFAPGT